MSTPVSVCMATCNGVRHLDAQVRSILEQLGPDDELVVVDDASSDETLNRLRGYEDPRIRIHCNEANIGHVDSFERALGLGRHDLLLMADQDDVWLPGRLDAMRAAMLASGCWVLSSNQTFINGQGLPTSFDCEPVRAADSNRHWRNIMGIFRGRRVYYGCAMAVSRQSLAVVLPIPPYVESHDLWIAMAGNVARANLHLERDTLARRVHGSNASIVRRPLRRKLWSRLVFLRSLLEISRRLSALLVRTSPSG